MFFMTQKRIDEFKNTKQYLGKGSEGECYLLNEKQIAKIYFRNALLFYPECFIPSDLLQFKDLDIRFFSFINELIYLRFKTIGSIAPYMPGESLYDSELYNEQITTLAAALDSLVPSIKELSENGIKVDDIAPRNILYGNGQFSFIDTRSYTFSGERHLYEENLQVIMFVLFHEVLKNSEACNSVLTFISKKHSGLAKLFCDMENDENPGEFLFQIKRDLEDFCEKEITCFNDAAIPLLRKLPTKR